MGEEQDKQREEGQRLFAETARRLDCSQRHALETCKYCGWEPDTEDHSHLIVDQRDASAKD